jgi:hypothetical protein
VLAQSTPSHRLVRVPAALPGRFSLLSYLPSGRGSQSCGGCPPGAAHDADLTDLCYGFCAFHRRYPELLDVSATRFEIEAEMTVHAMQDGLRIAEVPTLGLPRWAGKSKPHADFFAVRSGRETW